uniref:Uncharacterized protein n=1 Tax=Tanacetum cinerariifolium TaxID=118510 RepID=A0A6L2KY81_TANCI|nr:hypothetical protein [Tanacetum cinerariifolium]
MPWCDSQVDVNYDCSKPVTTHYFPKEREAASAKPHHMIASSNSRISSKNMPRFTSNDMVHNHYLEEAKQKKQECSRYSEPSSMPSARSKSITNGSKRMPRRNTQTSRNWPASKNSFVTIKTVPIADDSKNSRNFSDSKHFVCSTCQKCVFSANHDSCVTKFLKESSKLKIHDHSNEPSSSKLVPNVVPPTSKTATSRQVLELLFHHHIAMPRDLLKDTPQLEIAVLRYDGDEYDKGRMPTEIELTLEQSQQGASNDVLVSNKRVEELKRNVWINGENKQPSTTLKAETGSIHMLSVFTKVNSGIEDKKS